MATGVQVVFDCDDPDGMATFWAAALHYKKQDPPPGFASWPEFLTSLGIPEEKWASASAVVDPDGQGPRLYFQKVDNPKTGKNRVHLDLNISGGMRTPPEERRERIEAEVERLLGVGATRVRVGEEYGMLWVVMQDPEGNEFCVH
jgi:hypothetical protein